MPFAYKKIINQAWQLTRTNKFLWPFGLFLSMGNLLFILDNQKVDAIFLAISVLFFILYFRAKAGLTIAIKAIIEKQETSFGKAFTAGRLFYGRILVVYVFLSLALMALLALLSAPIVHLVQQKQIIGASVLGGIGAIIFVPTALAIEFILILSPMFIVFYDLKVKEAINKSFDLTSKHWPQLVGLGLLLFMVWLIAAPFGFLARFLYDKGGLWPIMFLILTQIVILILLSVISVFQQTAWVLAFEELIKPQKFEEAETLPEPEIVG